MREVRDAAGTVWTIFDVLPSATRRSIAQVQASYVSGWLCFHCDTERRRHPGIPPGWSTLPDDELLALVESATERRLAPLL